MANQLLAPGRECGACTACCVTLTIDEPGLRKPADVPCANLSPGGGCGIYALRPSVCRTWYCAWRKLAQLPDELRPDISGVLLRLNESEPSLVIQALEDPAKVLVRKDVLSVAARFIEKKADVSISLHGRPGHKNVILKINDHLTNAVGASDLAAAQQAMLQAIADASKLPTEQLGVSRLSPCACGSGKRFKDCHGKLL